MPPKMLPTAPNALPINPISIKTYHFTAKLKPYICTCSLTFYTRYMRGKKTGGRQKGTPNKITALAKEMIEKWLRAHDTVPKGEVTTLMMKDFMELDPRDRVKVSMEFIKIIMPKNINIDDSEVRLTIEDKLLALSNESADDD